MEYQWDFTNQKTYNNRVGQYKFKHQYDFALKNSSGKYDAILDVCGGSGRFVLPLFEYCKDITVVDLNQEALALLNNRNPNIKIIQGDFLQIQLNRLFSFILCIESIGCFYDIEVFFNKIKSLLSDDGRFIFTITNPGSWRFILRKIYHLKLGAHPYTEIKLSELKKILNKLDLEIVDMKGMNWMPLPLSSNSKLVYFFEFVEKWVGLNKWYSQSPWLLVSVRKKS